jgi:hypothetical protein
MAGLFVAYRPQTLLKTCFIIDGFSYVALESRVGKALFDFVKACYGASAALLYPPEFFSSHIESSLWLPYRSRS